MTMPSWTLPGLAPAGDPFLYCAVKTGGKKTRPVAPALRAALAADHRPGRPLKIAFGSDIASGHPRSGSPSLGGAKGEKNRWLETVRDIEKREVAASRPLPPLAFRAQSGGKAPVTCRSNS